MQKHSNEHRHRHENIPNDKLANVKYSTDNSPYTSADAFVLVRSYLSTDVITCKFMALN